MYPIQELMNKFILNLKFIIHSSLIKKCQQEECANDKSAFVRQLNQGQIEICFESMKSYQYLSYFQN